MFTPNLSQWLYVVNMNEVGTNFTVDLVEVEVTDLASVREMLNAFSAFLRVTFVLVNQYPGLLRETGR